MKTMGDDMIRQSRSTLEVFNSYRVNDYDMPRPKPTSKLSRVSFLDNTRVASFERNNTRKKSILGRQSLGGSQINFLNYNNTESSDRQSSSNRMNET